MPTLINFKICDNSPECGGIAVCPTKAMYFDQEKKSIVIDNDKCISCGLCRPQCPVSAIYVAKTKEEFEQLKRDVDNDPRTVKDLFVDRYGATPISDFFVITPQQLKEKVKNKGISLIELYNDESIQCLLKSIPIKDITDEMEKDVAFFKLKLTENIASEYDIKEVPSMLLFNEGIFKGKVQGYFDTTKIDLLKERINQILDINQEK